MLIECSVLNFINVLLLYNEPYNNLSLSDGNFNQNEVAKMPMCWHRLAVNKKPKLNWIDEIRKMSRKKGLNQITDEVRVASF